MKVKVMDTYQVTGRGTALSIKNPTTMTREDLSKYWIGKKVNGYKVIGVESYAKFIIYEGEPIGLLVCEI